MCDSESIFGADTNNSIEEDCVIWRYTDFAKFLYLITSEKLYFTRITAFDDPFEGQPTASTVEKLSSHTSGKDISLPLLGYQGFIPNCYISCWHMSDVESDAMWKLYLKFAEGIAIKTSVKRLMKSISVTGEDSLTIRKVHYIDFESSDESFRNLVEWPFLKRIAFEHEKECRAVVYRAENVDDGIELPVDLANLINEVYLSPAAPKYHKESLCALMEKFNLDITVKQSELVKLPPMTRIDSEA